MPREEPEQTGWRGISIPAFPKLLVREESDEEEEEEKENGEEEDAEGDANEEDAEPFKQQRRGDDQ